VRRCRLTADRIALPRRISSCLYPLGRRPGQGHDAPFTASSASSARRWSAPAQHARRARGAVRAAEGTRIPAGVAEVDAAAVALVGLTALRDVARARRGISVLSRFNGSGKPPSEQWEHFATTGARVAADGNTMSKNRTNGPNSLGPMVLTRALEMPPRPSSAVGFPSVHGCGVARMLRNALI